MRACKVVAASMSRLKGIDVFGGACMFTTVMLVAGLPCVAFDKTLHANHDALLREGILEMITLMYRCDPDALILVGPPCDNWIGLSRASHGRTIANIHGNAGNKLNKVGNAIAKFLSNVLVLAHHLDLAVFVEQPSNSVLWHFPDIRNALQLNRATRVTWHMFCFGLAVPKPQVGYCTAAWAPAFQRLARRLYRTMQRPMRRLTWRGAKRKYTGNKQYTRKSAEYPHQFVIALIELHFGISVAAWGLAALREDGSEDGFEEVLEETPSDDALSEDLGSLSDEPLREASS